MRFRATVPATVANLGSGFDCAALALSIHNTFEIEVAETASVTIEGEGAGELPRDVSNLVLLAIHEVAAAAGRTSKGGIALRCVNAIPVERGLGSSATAIVGGLLLANALFEANLGTERLLQMAATLEGHPDNVAACLGGGLALAYRTDDGWRAERVEPDLDLRPVVLVPEGARVITDEARRAVPSTVALSDAVFDLSRSALLPLAVTGRRELLAHALEDRLHEPHRLRMMPATATALAALRHAGVPACVAGSGPSILAFESGDGSIEDPGAGWTILRPDIDRRGAIVGSLD
jgi:homoserine kinase